MRREVELQRRIQGLDALGDAVGAMKSLSAVHFREARRAVEPARMYREGVERILGWAGATLGAGEGPAGLVVMGAELGLCGGFNARMVEAGAERRATLGAGPTFCVGHRAATLLGRRGVGVSQAYAGPMSVRGIAPLLLSLAEDVLTTYAQQRLSSFDIVSSAFDGVGTANPVCKRLLPVEAGQAIGARQARYVGAEHLASAVVREFLYITLYDLLLDSMAAEFGARLTATQAAESWLKERSEGLRRSLMATRREASTQEVIEITSGARARNRHR